MCRPDPHPKSITIQSPSHAMSSSEDVPWHFLDNHKKVQTFSWGLRPPQTPHLKSAAVVASASQFERLGQVGRCRGLQSGQYLVNCLECTRQRGQQVPELFCGPHSGTVSNILLSLSRVRKIMSTPMTLCYFCIYRKCMESCRLKPRLGIQNAKHNLGSAGTT